MTFWSLCRVDQFAYRDSHLTHSNAGSSSTCLTGSLKRCSWMKPVMRNDRKRTEMYLLAFRVIYYIVLM